jgi:two-component system nitrate/nitrite response regulator NarL
VQIKILVADDSDVVRRAIRQFLQQNSDFALVGEAADINEAIEKAGTLEPDIVIMDLHMAIWAEGDSDRLKGELSATRLIAISAASDDETSTLVERLGADRFIDKMQLYDKLIPTILELAVPRTFDATLLNT